MIIIYDDKGFGSRFKEANTLLVADAFEEQITHMEDQRHRPVMHESMSIALRKCLGVRRTELAEMRLSVLNGDFSGGMWG